MKIERLPSGTYRVRKTLKGKTHSFLFDERPTQIEIQERISSVLSEPSKPSSISFRHAAIQYIESRENVLSQSSIREYYRKVERLPEWFLTSSLCALDVQQFVNQYARSRSPKTVKDMYGFIASVLAHFDASPKQSIKLPSARKHERYCPTDNDVRAILTEARGTMFECAIGLAVCGLRRSEICCIGSGDVRGNIVKVNKALVQDKNKQWVVKGTKTCNSNREVPVPKELADLIKKQGKAYEGSPQSISNWLTRTEKKLGLPAFSVHMLRHYFASKLIFLGFSKREIEVLGGWEKNSQVLEEVYTTCMLANTEKGRKEIMDKFSEGLFS